MQTKKLHLSFLFIVCALISGSTMAQFAGGSGTELDPYQISTPEQLDSVRHHLDAHFVLVNDIDLDVAPYNSGQGWEPIGLDFNTPFSGNFNGQNEKISNLFIDRGNSDYVGLFGYVSDSNSEIQNLTLENVAIQGNNNTGALAGSFFNGTVLNISVTGSVSGNISIGGVLGQTLNASIQNVQSNTTITGYDNIGGLIGFSNSTVSNSFSDSNINASHWYSGGLIGYASTTSSLSGSFSYGTITAERNAGGLIGSNFGSIDLSYSRATVSVNDSRVGGLTGNNQGYISQSFFTGNVSGNTYVGGISGNNQDNAGTGGEISNSYTTGTVTGEQITGGIVGRLTEGSITNSYTVSTIIALGVQNGIGGFMGGKFDVNAIVSNGYWNMEESNVSKSVGFNDSTGITNINSTQMRAMNTFFGWDFATIWNIDEGSSFPYLKNNVPDTLPGIIELGSIAISQIFPEAAAEGDQVYLYGANFSSNSGDHSVTIGGITAPVIEAMQNRLTILVPELSPGLHTVSVTKEGETDELKNAFQFLIPKAINFESEVLLFGLNDIININAGDFNNNGDIDLVANSGALNQINIYYNNQDFQFTSVTNIHSYFENHDVHPVDIDGDGDLDVVASLITQNTPSNTSDDRVALFMNNGPESNPTYTESTISASINGARDVFPADLDGDGDSDVIAVSLVSGTLTWFRNDEGSFLSNFNITSSATNVSGVHASDLNNDGLLDVLSAGEFTVSWYPNEGNGVFTQKIDLISGEAFVSEVKAADLNGDGFMDVVTNATDSTIIWFENDGNGNFTRKNIATDLFEPTDFLPVDLDGDKDMDIIASSYDNGEIVWYQNFGDGRFSEKNVISATIDRAFGLDAADYDNDGDIDIIAVQRFASDGPGAYLFENISVVNETYALFPYDGDNLDAGSNSFPINTIGNPMLTSDPGGSIDSAYFFDGVDDYFQTQESTPFEFQSFTFSMWLNAYALPEQGKASVFMAKQPANVQTGYLLYLFPDGGIFTTLYDSTGGNTRRTGYQVNVGEWTHFAITYDGSVLQTYVNGVPEAAQQFDAEITYDSSPLTIGGYNHPTNSFNGKLDEIRIYDIALTSAEIASVYQSEKPAAFDNTSQWTSVISTSINGKQSSAEFGTQPTSTDGFDQGFDIPLPPAPTGDYVQLYFAHPEFGGLLGDRYRSDYKAYSDYSSSNSSWELSLFSTISGSASMFFSRPIGFEAPIKVIDEAGNEYVSSSGDLEVPYSVSVNQTLTFDVIVGDITPPDLSLSANMDGPQIWDVEFARTLNWSATDPSGIVNNTLEVSYDNGIIWNTVYSGTDESYVFTPDQAIIFNEETFFRITSTDGASTNFANSVTKQGTNAISIMSSNQTLNYNQGWQMVGAPFEGEIGSGSVLSDAIRYIWNNASFEYLLTDNYPEEEGIWLGGYSGGGDLLQGTVRESEATLTVKAGWNLITSTLLRNVKTDSILVDNYGSVSTFSDAITAFNITQPFTYDGSGYVNPSSLDISRGYWIGVTVDSVELRLPIHRFNPQLKQFAKSTEDNYVTLTVIDGDLEQDLSVVLGEGTSQPAPPPAPNTYALGLVGESTVLGNLYFKQYVSETDIESLEIPLSIAGPERSVTLKWEVNGFDGVPLALVTNEKLGLGESGQVTLSSVDINNTKIAFGAMAVGSEFIDDIPSELRLDQNYPNPFNPATSIQFGLPKDTRVTLSIYNMLGQIVAQILDNKAMKAGTHQVQFDASLLSSGTYLYKIETDNQTITKKMMLIK